LSYQWQKNGVNIAGAASSSYTTPATTTTDSGSTFDVVVSNPAGTMTSNAVTLTVSAAVVAPTITTQPASQTVTAGQTATFTVAATGTAPLSYQWQKNGVNIAGAASSSYTTPATTTTDSGSTFDVVVTNTAGTVTSGTVTLTVNNAGGQPPSVPSGLTATAASSSQINLSWSASTDTTGTLAGYKIYRGGSQIATSTTTSYQDTGLVASTTYGYTVAAYDTAGNTSAQSAGASATTLASSGGGGGIPNTLGWTDLTGTALVNVQAPPATYPSIQGSGGPAAVVSAWGGAAYDSKRNRLVVWGGGHVDYHGNEVYVIDLSANPIVPRRLNNPDVYSSGCGETVPGTNDPCSRHTYTGLAYLPTQDLFFALGGSTADQGAFTNASWLFNFTNLSWQRGPVNNGLQNGVIACDYDPNHDNVHCFDNQLGSVWDYNPAANTLTEVTNETGGFPGLDLSPVMDPAGKRFYLIGGGSMIYYNVSGNAPYPNRVTMTVPASCATFASAHYPGLAYDPNQKLLIEWQGGNSVYTYDPVANVCSTQTYPGGPPAAPTSINQGQQHNGTHGRFRYIPTFGVFIVVNDWNQDAYSLRLTPASGGGGSSGPTISGVTSTSITTSGATVNWTTDVAATSQVEYGTTTSYGTLTTLNSTLVTSHSAQLSGLATNTLYHYRVHSKNSAGVESISGDFAFQTASTTDTTPPSVSITSPASGATLSGTVTLAANASDNVGVTSVQFQLDGASIGAALTASPYSLSWDSTTAANGAHSLTAQARDAAGNVGTSVAVSVTISNSTGTADQNFQARCATAGVLSCQGFDTAATFNTAVNTTAMTDGFTSVPLTNISRDTTVFLSGGSSAKFFIPANSGLNGPGGNWWAFFGQGSANQRFGSNSDFYVQYAFRPDSNWVTKFVSDSYPKLSIFHSIDAGSCADMEITTINIHALDVPIMYTQCGARSLDTSTDGTTYNENGSLIYGQQGWTEPAPFTGYQCEYSNGAWNSPNCFNFQADTWYTLYWHVHVGTLTPDGQPAVNDSTIEAWVAPYGQQMRKWINIHNFPLFNDPPGNCNGQSPCPPFNVLELTQFMTANTTNSAATVWYDELIISNKPIPAPFGVNP